MLSLFDITINLIEAGAIACFVVRSLSFDKGKKICFVCLQIIVFTEICIANIVTMNTDIFAIVYFVSIFAITRVFSTSVSKDIAIISIVCLMITSLANILALFVVSNINLISVTEMISYHPKLFIIAITLSKIFLLIIQLIVSKAFKKIFIESTKYFMEFIVVLLLSRTSFMVLENMLFLQSINQSNIFIAVLLESMIVTLLIYLYYKVQDDNRINLGKLKKSIDITSYKEQFEAIKAYNNEIKVIKHDLKNMMNILKLYIEEDKKVEALNFITKKFDFLDKTSELIETEVDIINMIINNKRLTMDKNKIRFDVSIDLKVHPNVNDFELSSLLGNALDNAIEHIGVKKIIKLDISSFGSQTIFKVSNSIDKSVLALNPRLRTTKEDKNFHGLGIASMKEIVKKYEGSISFSEEDNYFICTIMISGM
ncbi:MAG: GHKL domain-containing protein [Anaerorhabdus sp.]|uniref:sensor histidine kinase n=1 Tax=Anaerorhabdus sp. TaxID=1872524 RepID=UPI002FC897CC